MSTTFCPVMLSFFLMCKMKISIDLIPNSKFRLISSYKQKINRNSIKMIVFMTYFGATKKYDKLKNWCGI